MFLVSMALVILRAVISEGEDDETSEQEERKEGTLGKEADAEA